MPRLKKRVRAGRHFDIPGWSVGYHDEISGHAAIRSPKGTEDMLFIMTTPDDREPRSLDEEVTVGLYELDDDSWELVDYADFNSVSDVISMSDAEIMREIKS